MMKSKISFICTAATLLLVSSCGGRQNADTGGRQSADTGLTSVRYDRLPQGKDILLSDWVGEPEFIALDSDTLEAITNGNNIAISDHYIGIYSDSEECFKLFDRATGKFLAQYRQHRTRPGRVSVYIHGSDR